MAILRKVTRAILLSRITILVLAVVCGYTVGLHYTTTQALFIGVPVALVVGGIMSYYQEKYR